MNARFTTRLPPAVGYFPVKYQSPVAVGQALWSPSMVWKMTCNSGMRLAGRTISEIF